MTRQLRWKKICFDCQKIASSSIRNTIDGQIYLILHYSFFVSIYFDLKGLYLKTICSFARSVSGPLPSTAKQTKFIDLKTVFWFSGVIQSFSQCIYLHSSLLKLSRSKFFDENILCHLRDSKLCKKLWKLNRSCWNLKVPFITSFLITFWLSMQIYSNVLVLKETGLLCMFTCPLSHIYPTYFRHVIPLC